MRSLFVYIILIPLISFPQDFKSQYDSFKREVKESYGTFRQECNQKYVDFLRTSWEWYDGKPPLPSPDKEKPVQPVAYMDGDEESATVIIPINNEPVDKSTQPIPSEPVCKTPLRNETYFTFEFYGVPCRVRLPQIAKVCITDCSTKSIADGWEKLNTDEMNNAIRDCLETRIRYNLCDWAYLMFLDELSHQYCDEPNGATLLKAFLFCQSGYQMRLARDNNKLHMLFGSQHVIYEMVYYEIDGTRFYTLDKMSKSVKICDFTFDHETAMSLWVDGEQKLGKKLSGMREIKSEKYPEVVVRLKVAEDLIKFYNTYPTSSVIGNELTRWAMYANVPLAAETRQILYPDLIKSIAGCSEEYAANKLLNWVQTGFVYELDDKVWGHDRTFFAEECLFYPYCDCEDRSILFSRLVRDLLGLDVALVYYPGHMATAVCFNDDVIGDAVMIDSRRFVICDPTYFGAPVGSQMPNLEYNKVQTIILKR